MLLLCFSALLGSGAHANFKVVIASSQTKGKIWPFIDQDSAFWFLSSSHPDCSSNTQVNAMKYTCCYHNVKHTSTETEDMQGLLDCIKWILASFPFSNYLNIMACLISTKMDTHKTKPQMKNVYPLVTPITFIQGKTILCVWIVSLKTMESSICFLMYLDVHCMYIRCNVM